VTAHEVPRITPDFLGRERAAVGEWWFRQEYLCEFVDTSDQLFSSASIAAAVAAEVRPLEVSL
jgi:hypothetical protein